MWCSKQRGNFQADIQADIHVNKPHLSQEQIEKLVTIGFQFCLQNEKPKKPKKNLKWDRYEELVDFKKENGHANPQQREGQLGTWCHNQRTLFQNQFSSTGKKTLFRYQEEKLIAIGFQFNLKLGASVRCNAPTCRPHRTYRPGQTCQTYRKCLLCQTCKLCFPWRSRQTAYLQNVMLLPSKKSSYPCKRQQLSPPTS